MSALQFKQIGKEIATEHLKTKAPLNELVEKTASRLNLNEEQIKRVIEYSNLHTHLELSKVAGKNYVIFDVAEPEVVLNKLGTKLKKTARISNYVDDTEYKDIFTPAIPTIRKQQESPSLEKEAELKDEVSEREYIKRVRRMQGELNYLGSEFTKLGNMYSDNVEDFYYFIKQAALGGENVGDIFRLIKEASPTFHAALVPYYEERLNYETRLTPGLIKEATQKPLNYNSEFFEAAETLEFLGGSITKLATSLNDYYTEFKTFVNNKPQYTSIAKHGSFLGAIAGAAKWTLKHPIATAAAVSVPIAYYFGKKSGAKSQSLMNAKFVNNIMNKDPRYTGQVR